MWNLRNWINYLEKKKKKLKINKISTYQTLFSLNTNLGHLKKKYELFSPTYKTMPMIFLCRLFSFLFTENANDAQEWLGRFIICNGTFSCI